MSNNPITAVRTNGSRPPSGPSIMSDLAVKVPAITMWFWVIKVLCTTVGETAADYLNVNLHLGLTGTSVVTAVLLAVALALQVTAKQYIPWRYWLTVTLVSVFGTLVTDNLTDHLKVSLITSTIVFSVLLALTFAVWYAVERTLSIHSVRTRRRELFYWLAIFVTFALGTATGDLMAERLGLGYLPTGLLIAGTIGVLAALSRVRMHSILAFWAVYILTRPLGASIGDFMAQPQSAGGRGLGTTTTSVVFLAAIAAVVAYLTITKADVTGPGAHDETPERGGVWQTAVLFSVVAIASIVGYNARKTTLTAEVPTATAPTATAPAANASAAAAGATKLGDLTAFRTITQDTLDRLNAGSQPGATKRVDDLEREWDLAQARLKARDTTAWTTIDGKVDTVLTKLRAASPKIDSEKAALTELLTALT